MPSTEEALIERSEIKTDRDGPPPRAFPLSEFCRIYGIGRTLAYDEIADGRLRAVKVGRRTLITRDAAEEWLAGLARLRSRGGGAS